VLYFRLLKTNEEDTIQYNWLQPINR